MSRRRCESVARLEEHLDGASRAVSALAQLDAGEAARVAARMDRLASQLLEISEPPATEAVCQRLRVTAASGEELMDKMDARSLIDRTDL